jgi:hypothetical protein
MLRLDGRSDCLANLPLRSRQLIVQALVFLPEQLDLGALFGDAFRHAEQLAELSPARFRNLLELGP